ncbi:hypothetical protein BJV77DRAFT_206713 [Russula vinacea]|nr:hypothetical protein BJV77DRAFT_206713 [Russula vinacea]
MIIISRSAQISLYGSRKHYTTRPFGSSSAKGCQRAGRSGHSRAGGYKVPRLRKTSWSFFPYGTRCLRPDVPPGAFSEMWKKFSLEWDDARFHAQALASEAVYNPELSALPTVLRTEIVTGPKISSLDIQAWIRDTEAPVFKLRGMLDETDSWHFGRLVATLQNNHTYAVVEWEDQGRTLERLLLAPLNEYLVCAFISDGIEKRPTQQPPKAIRVQKGKSTKADRVQEGQPMKEIRVQKGKQSKATRVQKGQPSKAIRVQRGQSVLQTDPKAVPTSPHGEAAESTITAPQPPPKQTQADHHPLKHHPGSQPDPVVMLMSSDDAAERTITSLESSSEQLQADYPPNRRPRLQPDPVAMQTSPDEAAERAMPSPEPSPDQQQVDEHPSDAMEVSRTTLTRSGTNSGRLRWRSSMRQSRCRRNSNSLSSSSKLMSKRSGISSLCRGTIWTSTVGNRPQAQLAV